MSLARGSFGLGVPGSLPSEIPFDSLELCALGSQLVWLKLARCLIVGRLFVPSCPLHARGCTPRTLADQRGHLLDLVIPFRVQR
eukprot:4462185-Amphidinium_carterae.1